MQSDAVRCTVGLEPHLPGPRCGFLHLRPRPAPPGPGPSANQGSALRPAHQGCVRHAGLGGPERPSAGSRCSGSDLGFRAAAWFCRVAAVWAESPREHGPVMWATPSTVWVSAAPVSSGPPARSAPSRDWGNGRLLGGSPFHTREEVVEITQTWGAAPQCALGHLP